MGKEKTKLNDGICWTSPKRENERTEKKGKINAGTPSVVWWRLQVKQHSACWTTIQTRWPWRPRQNSAILLPFFFCLFSFFKYIPVNHAHRFKYHLPSFPSRMFFFFPLLFLHWHLVSGLQIRHYLLAVVCVVFLSCLFFVFRSKLSFILSLPITQVGDRTIVTMEASIMAAVNPLALFR